MAGSPKRDGRDPGAASKQSTPEGPQQDPSLDRVIQAQIGDKLRAMYGELVEQPVPDRLTSILDRLSTAKAGGDS
ncbi:MAG: hypothetical protein JWQ36_1663 [Enterovirga sp.]|jgi:hypothetical protein|nr:hypothetical protein [Enterovirga sp.]